MNQIKEIRFTLITLSTVLILISCAANSIAQTINPHGFCGTKSNSVVSRKGFVELLELKSHLSIEEATNFPEGRDSLLAFLNNNLQYPEWAIESNIQGKVILEFSVSEKGSISDIIIIREVHGGGKVLTPEAIRLVESLPNFRPAESNGKKIPSKMEMTLNFILR